MYNIYIIRCEMWNERDPLIIHNFEKRRKKKNYIWYESPLLRRVWFLSCDCLTWVIVLFYCWQMKRTILNSTAVVLLLPKKNCFLPLFFVLQIKQKKSHEFSTVNRKKNKQRVNKPTECRQISKHIKWQVGPQKERKQQARLNDCLYTYWEWE